MSYIFEWEPAKAVANKRKHRVAFDEARTVFADPLVVLMPDPDHSFDEERYVALGFSDRRRLLVVAFVERPPRTRLTMPATVRTIPITHSRGTKPP